ncbi:MAG: hypothetical protein JO290_03330 [Sphingomonadaceae bacterium]|nr:hypothetical protein [Sphingomonadaceae bacterium]
MAVQATGCDQVKQAVGAPRGEECGSPAVIEEMSKRLAPDQLDPVVKRMLTIGRPVAEEDHRSIGRMDCSVVVDIASPYLLMMMTERPPGLVIERLDNQGADVRVPFSVMTNSQTGEQFVRVDNVAGYGALVGLAQVAWHAFHDPDLNRVDDPETRVDGSSHEEGGAAPQPTDLVPSSSSADVSPPADDQNGKEDNPQ